MKIVVRIEMEDEKRFEYYAGEPASCPPIPRVGEYISLDEYTGHIVGVGHYLQKNSVGPVLYIEIDTVDSPNGIPSRLL
jgi:hypothetical protein